MGVQKNLQSLMDKFNIGLTPLRKDILIIFIKHNNKSLTAYQILDLLMKKRPKAKPPTVYRVLEYFLEQKIIHRLDSSNSYILCQSEHQLDEIELLAICQACRQVKELDSPVLTALFKQIAKDNKMDIINHHVEIKTQCKKCLTG